MLQERRIGLHRRAYDQGVGRLQMLRQLALQLICGQNRPARFLQFRHR